MEKSSLQKSKDKYLAEKVETFVVRVPKGQKEVIQEYAKEQGKSLNSFVVDLINNDLSISNKSDDSQVSDTAKEQENEPMPYIKHVAYEGRPIPQEILREVVSDTRKMADLIDHAKLDAIEFIRDKPFDLEQLKMINTYIRALYHYDRYDKK